MAHEISRKNFFDTTGKPAWHNLSIFEKLGVERQDREYSAEEVYALFGQPQYSVTDLYYKVNGEEVGVNDKMIIRHPVSDDPVFKVIGRASENYELIGGGMAAEIWDKQVQMPVETMMMLQHDGILAITAKLPSYDVKGEEVINYLVFSNGMNGRTASRADVSATRVVCANTLAIAQRYSVHHTAGSIERLTDFMKDIAGAARFQMEVMHDAYNILAETPAEKEAVRSLTKIIFPDPKRPDPNFGYKLGFEDAQERWERAMERTQETRFLVMENFAGKAIGFDSPDCKTQGTAWHALNAFTEVLTHSRTSDFNARAESLLIGTRNELIKKATSHVISWIPAAQEVVARKRELSF